MIQGSIWARLGIAPTRDRALIRKAYAAQLKLTQPEDDADGFQALRQAYDLALRHAQAAPTAPVFEGAHFERLAIEPVARRSEPGAHPPPPEIVTPPPAGGEDTLANLRQLEADHFAALGKLEVQLRSGAATPQDLVAAFRALVGSKAMDRISVHDRTETLIAHLILRQAPASDPLLDPAIRHFDWASSKIQAIPPIVGAVLARQRDLKVFVNIEQSTMDGRRSALAALRRPPVLKRRILYRFTPGLSTKVRDLLQQLERFHPTLITGLDPEALAWWRALLSQPRFDAISALAALVLPVLVAGATALNGQTLPTVIEAYVLVAATVIGQAALRFYGLEWTRRLWRARDSRPLWLEFGWAPFSLAVVLAAALAPPGFVSRIVVWSLAILALYWALVTGDADRRPGVGKRLRVPGGVLYFVLVYVTAQVLVMPNIRWPWYIRAASTYLFLYIGWLAFQGWLPDGVAIQLGPCLLVAAGTFVAGSLSLEQAWRTRMTVGSRRIALATLGAMALLACAGLFLQTAWPALRLPVFWLVAAAVLLHKTPAATLSVRASDVRHWIMRTGWFLWLIAAGVLSAYNFPTGSVGPWIAGPWLMSGVVATVIGDLIATFPQRQSRPGRQRRQPLAID